MTVKDHAPHLVDEVINGTRKLDDAAGLADPHLAALRVLFRYEGADVGTIVPTWAPSLRSFDIQRGLLV